MRILKIILKRTILSIVVLIVSMIVLASMILPHYKNHNHYSAYFQYSKDKQYKGILFSPDRNKIRTIAILTRTSDNQVLAYSDLHGRDDCGEIDSLWFNYCNNTKDLCFQPCIFMEPIKIPPTLWQRFRGWIVVKTGFEVPPLPKDEN